MNWYYGVGIGAAIAGLYYSRQYITLYVAGIVMQGMKDKMDQELDNEGIAFVPFARTKSARVLFKDGGKSYNVCIPYDRSKSRAMLRKKVILIGDGFREDITHKPGIPYLLTPAQMGGQKIIVTKDNKIIHEYGPDDMPNYLDP